jgi:hypothetical protein
VPQYLVRLWVHDADDGLLPEITIRANRRLEAAALALQHFVWSNRPIRLHSYLECEPHDGTWLRVADVLNWLQSAEGCPFAIEWNLSIGIIRSAIAATARVTPS